MIKKSIVTVLILAIFWAAEAGSGQVGLNEDVSEKDNSTLTESQLVYQNLTAGNESVMPSWKAFSTAFKGFENLKTSTGKVKKNILSVVDFSLPSTEKRFWVIDLDNNKVLFNDYVAHGRNSGNNVAESFSNIPSSNSSSIGFYVTAEKYNGKHGLSLRLDGMDKGFNDNARKRAIVLHGADYVSSNFIKKYGRLGRSLGCPSVSMDIHKEVINAIYGGSVLFIYTPDNDFMVKSKVLNPAKKLASLKG